MSPSLNAIGFLSVFSQGIGSAGNIELAELKKRLEAKSGDEREIILKKIKSIIIKSTVSGIVTNVIAATALVAARKPIVDFFVHSSTSDVHQNAEITLLIAALNAITDSPRIISASLLNP